MAMRWTGIHPDAAPDRTFEAVLGLDTAASWDDFRASLALYEAPAQNFVYADVDGRVGYQLPGYVPIRSDPGDRSDRPVSGSDGSGDRDVIQRHLCAVPDYRQHRCRERKPSPRGSGRAEYVLACRGRRVQIHHQSC
jgi:hypothetical protein